MCLLQTSSLPERVGSSLPGEWRVMNISNVDLLDLRGSEVTSGGSDLSQRILRFTVEGADAGDVFRVEVLPDPTTGPPKDIPQIIAGVFEGQGRQTMTCRLEGFAQRDYDVSIYRIDAKTAERDVNIDAPLAWRDTIPVH